MTVRDQRVQGPHACFDMDRRTCYELREYGFSPVLRHAEDHSEGAYMTVDEYGECYCDCHTDQEDDEL